MKISMLDLGAQYKAIGSEIENAIKAVLESQQFIMGPEVRELERELASYCGTEYAVGCASGSDALLLALMACGVGTDDEVITTPFSFFATAGSIVRLGAKPVFVDIHPETFNIDERMIESAVTKRTRAIMPVHLFGQCAEMQVIKEVAERYGLSVIEDAAQAIGAQYGGKRAGGLGAVGAFSFYPSKNLGGMGDGGAMTTNDGDLAERLRSLRSHGAKKKYFHDEVGINSRLDSLQAAILRVKFKYLDEWARKRRENAARYGKLFMEAGLVQDEMICLPQEAGAVSHVYNQYVIRAKKRDELKKYLAEQGIGTEIYYPLPLHRQVCFRDLGVGLNSLPKSDAASEEALAIPVHPEMDEIGQEYVVSKIASFYK